MRTPYTLTGRRFMALLLALLTLCASVPVAMAEETEIFGCVTQDQVKLRQNASKSAGYWEMLPQGWVMTILGTTTAQGSRWYRVRGGVPSAPDGTYTGYILGDCFRPLTLEETNAWLYNPTQGVIAGQPLETQETEEENEPVFAAQGGWITTTVGGVNLRVTPQAAADSAAVLPQGAMLQVIGYSDGWYNAAYNDVYGYISTAYARVASADEVADYMNGIAADPAGDEGESDALPVLYAAADAASQDQAVVYTTEGETVSLRSDMLKTAFVLAYVPNGAAVTVSAVEGDWATVIYNGTVGYMLSKYLIAATVPAGTEEPAQEGGALIGGRVMATVDVGSGTLPLLKEPSDTSDSLKSIPNRAVLYILEARTDWSKTIYAGKTGYVDTRLLAFSTATSGYAPYVTITSEKRVNVRQNAKKNAKVLTHVTHGTKLPLWGSPWTNDGYTWYPVTVNNVDAYVRGDTCRLVTMQEQSGQQPAPTPEPAGPSMSNVFESLSSALNIRAAATTSSKSLGKLRLHNRMTFTGTTTVKGELWYKVNYRGTAAFVMGKFVRVLTEEEAGGSATPAPAVTPTPAIPVGLSDVAYTLKNNIYVRKENTMKSSSLTKIRKSGSYMTWLGEAAPDKNGENYSWYHIEYLNNRGWIRGDLIHVMTEQEWEKAFGKPTPTPVAPTVPTAAPTVPVVTPEPTPTPRPGGETLTDVAYTLKNNVFIRKQNTMNSTSVTKVYTAHSYMTLLGDVKADKNGENYTWYNVSYNKKTGWIRGDLIHVMTNEEWDDEFPTPVPAVTATPEPTPVPGGDDQEDLGPYVAYDILRYGATGMAVTQMQQVLYEEGYLAPANVTGTFNEATRQAVRTFQADQGLTVDGVAGQLTLAALYKTVAYDATLYPVEKVTWSVATKVWPRGSVATVTDVATGLSFASKRYAGGSHADVEPLTAADTAIMCRIYGVETSQDIAELNLYQRRPIWVTIGGRTLAASMYGVPHNPGGDTLPDNDYTGQFCIHFVDSRKHSTNEVDRDHQAAINYAYNNAPVKK